MPSLFATKVGTTGAKSLIKCGQKLINIGHLSAQQLINIRHKKNLQHTTKQLLDTYEPEKGVETSSQRRLEAS